MSDQEPEETDVLPPLHKALEEDDWKDMASERVTWTVKVSTGEVCVMAPGGRTASGRSLPRALSALWQQLA